MFCKMQIGIIVPFFSISIFFLDVCFLRLDFECFTTVASGLTTEVNGGQCTDQFTVTVGGKPYKLKNSDATIWRYRLSYLFTEQHWICRADHMRAEHRAAQ